MKDDEILNKQSEEKKTTKRKGSVKKDLFSNTEDKSIAEPIADIDSVIENKLTEQIKKSKKTKTSSSTRRFTPMSDFLFATSRSSWRARSAMEIPMYSIPFPPI